MSWYRAAAGRAFQTFKQSIKQLSRVCVDALCVCAPQRSSPGVSVSAKADELTVELGQGSGHRAELLPFAPFTVIHLHHRRTSPFILLFDTTQHFKH